MFPVNAKRKRGCGFPQHAIMSSKPMSFLTCRAHLPSTLRVAWTNHQGAAMATSLIKNAAWALLPHQASASFSFFQGIWSLSKDLHLSRVLANSTFITSRDSFSLWHTILKTGVMCRKLNRFIFIHFSIILSSRILSPSLTPSVIWGTFGTLAVDLILPRE